MQQAIVLQFGRPIIRKPANDSLVRVDADRVRDVAIEMMEDVPSDAQWWLQAFAEGLQRLDPMLHGFAVEDVAKVVQAWEGFEGGGAWDGGFIVDLRSGLRARIACLAMTYDLTREAAVDVSFVPPNYDEQRAHYPWAYHSIVYQTDLPELQEYLRRLSSS